MEFFFFFFYLTYTPTDRQTVCVIRRKEAEPKIKLRQKDVTDGRRVKQEERVHVWNIWNLLWLLDSVSSGLSCWSVSKREKDQNIHKSTTGYSHTQANWLLPPYTATAEQYDWSAWKLCSAAAVCDGVAPPAGPVPCHPNLSIRARFCRTYGPYRSFPARSPPCSCRKGTCGKRGSFYACHWGTAESGTEGWRTKKTTTKQTNKKKNKTREGRETCLMWRK